MEELTLNAYWSLQQYDLLTIRVFCSWCQLIASVKQIYSVNKKSSNHSQSISIYSAQGPMASTFFFCNWLQRRLKAFSIYFARKDKHILCEMLQ